MATYLSSPDHPLTHAERKRALARAERISWILLLLSFVTFIWGWVFPRPYYLVIALLVLLPWAAVTITALSHGFFRLDDEQRKTQNLAFALLMPGFALAIRAAEDFNLLAWNPALGVSLALGAALWIAAAVADARLRQMRPRFFAVALACVAYGYGASTEANALLDRFPATVYHAKVLHKHISYHHRRSSTYYLELTHWGHQPSDDASIPRTLYESVQKGDSVCVLAHPGALHVQWYVVSDCRDFAESTIPAPYR